jgi:hypothetical protein
MMKDADALIGNMHFEHYTSKRLSEDLNIESYRATLSTFLAQENVLKMLLSKQDIPSE